EFQRVIGHEDRHHPTSLLEVVVITLKRKPCPVLNEKPFNHTSMAIGDVFQDIQLIFHGTPLPPDISSY
ncbi:MAG: hypothetical protein AAF327_17515, partial [Cyanobacteria bacterium P01_A01_bin.37]